MNELERSLQKIKNALRGMPYNWDGKNDDLFENIFCIAIYITS